MKRYGIHALVVTSCLIQACTTGHQKNKNAGQSTTPNSFSDLVADRKTLTREAAATRSKQIHKVSYQLALDFTAGSEEFKGKTVIRFDIKPKAKEQGNPILLDLEGGTVTALSLNKKELTDFNTPERFDGHHLFFKIEELQNASNEIEVSYSHPYSDTGNGLHRFKDPADQEEYLYSNFEPYNAHRMFPCFDQPDLKATYQLTVQAPAKWEVISSTAAQLIEPIQSQTKKWTFPTTKSFSTYVFAVVAGPFASWKSDANGIPLGLYARKSLAKYMDAEEWFKVTRDGLSFYEVQFGFPYPFSKYDQILVPDFNAGAMENVGAVTFSESFVYRTPVTQDRRRQRANVILHEMAHMWFGNLVTMNWWNGLWLNESFATFMATTAVEKATNYSKGNWQSFFVGTKDWAYQEDQLVTTHPIELPVPDTHHAQTNFDGITYGKGASTLKQLSFYLGEDNFREGLQRYFQNYAFRNTTIGEFFKMQTEASGRNLFSWQKSWLLTSGVNTIETVWKCDSDSPQPRITEFKIIQHAETVPGSTYLNELRNHRTELAFFKFPKRQPRKNFPLRVVETLEVAYGGPETSVDQAIGKNCPDLVFPNHQDYDYVKVDLDPTSLSLTQKHLAQIADPLTRQMLWHTLWGMVIDSKLSSQKFIDAVLTQTNQERDTLILSRLLQFLSRNFALKLLEPSLRPHYQEKVEAFTKSHLLSAPGGSDLQLIWFQAYLNTAESQEANQYLLQILDGKKKLNGFKIDQERRWNLVKALSRNGFQKAPELIAAELKNDPTNMGKENSIASEASIPDPAIKKKWFDEMSLTAMPGSKNAMRLALLREAMANFQIAGQENLIRETVQRYFKTLDELVNSPTLEQEEFLRYFTGSMFPSLCDPGIVEITSTFIDSHPRLPIQVLKSLKVSRQKETRCINSRKKSAEDSAKS
jgi:aminopeptidase N